MNDSTFEVEDLCAALLPMLRLMVQDTDSVQITFAPAQGAETVTLHVQVTDRDLGRIIGKDGRTARALRVLVLAVSQQQQGRRFALDFTALPKL